MHELESRIEMLETEQSKINRALVAASSNGDGHLIAELAKKDSEQALQLAKSYQDLEATTSEFESKSKEFAARLDGL